MKSKVLQKEIVDEGKVTALKLKPRVNSFVFLSLPGSLSSSSIVEVDLHVRQSQLNCPYNRCPYSVVFMT